MKAMELKNIKFEKALVSLATIDGHAGQRFKSARQLSLRPYLSWGGLFHFAPKTESVKCEQSAKLEEKKNVRCLTTLVMPKSENSSENSSKQVISSSSITPWNTLRKTTSIIGFLILAGLGLSINCPTAQADTMSPIMVKRIVSAIYRAEGADKALKPYGILSVPCTSRLECKKICENTVKNNWKRYQQWGHKKFPTYLAFLASRYAPIGVSNDPTNLNQNWLNNVQHFLYEGVS